MLHKRLGLRAQLLIAGLLVQIFTLAIFAWGAASQFENYLTSSLSARLEQTKPLLNASLLTPLLQKDYASINAVLKELISGGEFLSIEVCDTQGNLVASAGATGGSRPPDASDWPLQISEAIRGPQAMNVQLQGQTVGTVKFVMSLSGLQDMATNVLLNIAYLSLLALILFMVVLWAIAQVLTRPLLQLAQTVERMQQGNYDLEIPIRRKDEIGVLVNAFNRMTRNIQEKISNLTKSESVQKNYLKELQAQKIVLEKALEQAQGATKTKAEFLSNMSHEIRTPMNAILGFSQLLKETELTQRQSEYVGSVHTSATSLLSIFNDILDYSKLEAGQIKLVIQTFSISELTQAALNIFSFHLKQKNLQLSLNMSPEVPKYLHGDPTRIRQVLVNLLANAVKFTESGRVDLTVSTQIEADGYLCLKFEVRDTGVGMSPDQQARIFAPFSQADGSSTKKFGGSGLGLAISRRLIDLMGGELWVESALGKGSCVTFTCSVKSASDGHFPSEATHLAQIPSPPPLLEPPSSATRSLTGVRVLLVEDDRFNAMLALAFLHKLGMHVRQANNGLEAIDAMKQQSFDMVLMDLQMPEMDGLSAARAIKSTWGDAAPPIVAMSGASDIEDRQACLDSGMVAHISKPVDFDILRDVMQRNLQSIAPTAPMASMIPVAEIDSERLRQLSIKLEQCLADNLTSARKVCDDISITLQATAWAFEFRPVAELTRRLKYKEALLALAEFRQKFVGKSH